MNPDPLFLQPETLRRAVRHEGGITRRLLLETAARWSALPLLAAAPAVAPARVRWADDPFTLGVASGDPDHRSVVLWTRLAPAPLVGDGGMPQKDVAVRWEMAEDAGFRRVVAQGVANASPILGHSVHVDVDGLAPDRWYFYRFHAGDTTSPVGRTRTLPAPDAAPGRMTFAFASCQHYEHGHFTAYEAMARDAPDLVFHLGDYIYEGAGRDGNVRRHAGPRLIAVEHYRVRYAQYRTDPLLRAMHAAAPWFVTWDDHEVENNYAGAVSQNAGQDPAEFLLQRAAAYQAYYEAMPLRRGCLPKGADLRLHRTARYGRLAAFHILDTRQYRTDQPNGDKGAPLNAAAMDPRNSLLGRDQRRWLEGELSRSTGAWNVLAQQVMMALVDRGTREQPSFSMDQWPGAAHERIELVRFLERRKVANPVVLTGDIHTNWVNDLRVDDRRPETRVVATEFVGTSISSGGNGSDQPSYVGALKAANSAVRFHNAQRGYVRCTITPERWRSDYVVVDQVAKPGGTASNRASFVVESGRPGALEA